MTTANRFHFKAVFREAHIFFYDKKTSPISEGELACKLYGCKSEDFVNAFLKPRVKVGTEWVNKGQNLEQVCCFFKDDVLLVKLNALRKTAELIFYLFEKKAFFVLQAKRFFFVFFALKKTT